MPVGDALQVPAEPPFGDGLQAPAEPPVGDGLPVPAEPPGRELLRDKTVVITAAAGTGIGCAVARRCMAEGARVLISDIHERRLGETADALAEEFGMRPATALCNVTEEGEVQGLLDVAVAEMGHVDVMINNAGLGGTANLVDMTDEQWHAVLDVTLNGTMRATRAALRHMMPRRSGVIVNNASVMGWRAQPGQCHYAAAKAGVMALTRCAAMEAAGAGVRSTASPPAWPCTRFWPRCPARSSSTIWYRWRPSTGPPSPGRWPT